jgi:hypothetical protein
MAEESNETQELELQPQAEGHDWFLGVLVGLANQGASMGITLQVGGLLVSGTLIGGAEYFEGFASDFSSVFEDKNTAEQYRSAFAAGAENYKARTFDDSEEIVDAYIHIKGARFFNTSGKAVPANRGVWWRGRLSEVSGFCLGSLSPADDV